MGVAGGNISQSNFGEAEVQAGTKGEERVGAILNEAAERLGATVWHGIHFSPNSKSRADVDHAVAVNDNELWLIDAKMWAYGTTMAPCGAMEHHSRVARSTCKMLTTSGYSIL